MWACRRTGPRCPYRGLERHLRHAARPHPGAGQARGGARAARAAAPARRAAADRARLGDAAAAGARRLGRARRGARPARARGGRRAQRRARGSASRSRRTARWARSRASCSRRCAALARPVEIDPTPQEVPWTVPLDEDGEHATYDAAPGRDLLRRRHARGARAGRVPGAVPRPLDAGQRVVGLVRPRRQPLLRASRPTPPSDDFIMRNSMDAAGGRGRLVAGRRALPARPPSTPTPTRRRTGSPSADLSPAAARWDEALGEYVLDWDDVIASADPHALGARVRPLGVPARLHRLRLGSRAWPTAPRATRRRWCSSR